MIFWMDKLVLYGSKSCSLAKMGKTTMQPSKKVGMYTSFEAY